MRSLLTTLRPTVLVPGIKRFVVDENRLKAANVGHRYNDFDELFLHLTERDVGNLLVTPYRLKSHSMDSSVLEELMRKHRELIHVAHLFALLKLQKDGRKGILLTDEEPNIAFAQSRYPKSGPAVIFARWNINHRYWRLGAHFPKKAQYEWVPGNRFLSGKLPG